jgi:mannose-6-phosphate isomerase-like protein (cupin superfamily)
MDMKLIKGQDIEFFQAKTNFTKAIQFKAYELDGEVYGDYEHTHDYMQIWYVCGGICSHWLNGREYRMVRGDLFVIPPYVVHKVKPHDGKEIKIIGLEFSANFINDMFDSFTKNKGFFDFAYLEPFLVSEEMVKPKLVLSCESQVQVEALIKEMIREYNLEDEYYELFIKANLLKLLAR